MSVLKGKGQVQVMSLVIMAGIVIALVGVAYMWGGPVIEKRSVYTQYTSAEKFMNDLNNKIATLASTCTTPGGCTQSVDIPQIDGVAMNFDNDDNSIFFMFPSSQRMLSDEQIALNTPYTGEVADYGTAPPGLLTAQGITTDGIYVIRFILHYRTLVDEDSDLGYKISISGNTEGTNKIIMTYTGTEKIPAGNSPIGKDLTVSKIQLKIL